MIPERKWLAKAHMLLDGGDYSANRTKYDFCSLHLMDAIGIPNIYGEDHQYLLNWLLYARRPDGKILSDGDHRSKANEQYFKSSYKSFVTAGNYYKNPYYKWEGLREDIGVSSPPNGLVSGFSHVEFLLFNDPDFEARPVSELPLSYYYPNPKIGIIARTSWDDGLKSPAVVAEMKINETYTNGHQHLDAGAFQLYYKGMLAVDSGWYQSSSAGDPYANEGNTVFGTTYFYNYQRRTIAHNCMLVYDPNEDMNNFSGYANDGGQRMPPARNPLTLDKVENEYYDEMHVGEHLALSLIHIFL